MANEITIQANLSCTNGGFSFATREGSVRVNQSVNGGGGPGVLTITTSDTALSLGTYSAKGYCFIKNLDPTNYVEFGPESGGAIVKMIRLNAGEYALFRFVSAAVLRAQANTASVKCYIAVLEN
jgi:hypothetical protein